MKKKIKTSKISIVATTKDTTSNGKDHLILFAVDTIKSLIVSSVNVSIGKNPRVELLHYCFVLRICCPDELVISYVQLQGHSFEHSTKLVTKKLASK